LEARLVREIGRTFYWALVFVAVVIAALVLSPRLLWNFVRYMIDGFRAMR
jgi:hypothetical protein